MASRSDQPSPREPTRPRKRDVASEGQPLQEQLATMKAEIDALQISTAEPAKPWYRQASVLIASLALFFSFGTTFYSLKRTQEQDIHNSKVELRDLIQRLTAIPVRNLDLDRKYPKDAGARVQASSLLNTENTVLAKQAVDVIDQIPDEVSAVEFIAVASALALSGDYDRTRELYSRALDTSDDATDFSNAARSLGVTAFSLGDVRGGRTAFQQALDVFDRFPTSNSYFRTITHITTEVTWAQAELFTQSCPEGLAHLSRAESALSSVGEDLLGQRFKGAS
jgi:tetratricopeptide (TPR) repeat protein